ncbi:hypothetical protein ON010_g10474 [Phytophthora cinnamomi]|nr:hypothetical protein ON010_g10474 [Phytophthora cinnamomi]
MVWRLSSKVTNKVYGHSFGLDHTLLTAPSTSAWTLRRRVMCAGSTPAQSSGVISRRDVTRGWLGGADDTSGIVIISWGSIPSCQHFNDAHEVLVSNSEIPNELSVEKPPTSCQHPLHNYSEVPTDQQQRAVRRAALLDLLREAAA